ncbi:CCR4-NOT transcription complex subunit 6 [Nematocida homosporus]|uniref:CCR4-NOT transcription complex subunit 6 n=1 Tax=Nematocida homosporus TaxID=1912981 RepID=UPI002220339A|nr:CCR4-NOT transcription complex subunit 6 [Nematocida homosporus]KAI5185300.1 CCR4-NOT transcription complex subunit 6 [Nematocida homosporus]
MEEEYTGVKRPGCFASRANRIFSKPLVCRKPGGEKVMDEVVGLDLAGQGLKMLSPRILLWEGLTTLVLSGNSITDIPVEISRLTSLAHLDLSHNRIKKVPKELGRLYTLRELKLNGNLLSSVPQEFGMLYQMERLDLDDNPLVGQIAAVYHTSGGLGVVRYCRDNVALSFPYWEREWIFNGQESTSPGYNDIITVATYNILCPTYTNNQMFAYVPSWALQWETRKTNILQELASYSADIICIQEMDTASYLEFFREQLKIRGDYDSVFYQKTRARTMSEYDKRAVDGCAIFWKSMFFQLVEQKCILLSQLFSQKHIAEHEHIANRVLCRDNIALVVVLEREGGKLMVVANAHIHWDPEFPDVKTLQGIMLLKEVEAVMKRYPGAELVICGDFNSLPSSALHELVTSGEMRPNNRDLLGLAYEPYSSQGYSHQLGLQDSYSFVNMGFTNFTPGFIGTIDYIWHNDRLQPVCSLGPIDEEYLSKIVGLPTPHYPSDHLMLVTQFRCKSGPWRNAGK